MPLFSNSYCGVPWYLANSACQSASDIGGSTPVTGCHSVIERPEPVSRVRPPTTTIAAMRTAMTSSQMPTISSSDFCMCFGFNLDVFC